MAFFLFFQFLNLSLRQVQLFNFVKIFKCIEISIIKTSIYLKIKEDWTNGGLTDQACINYFVKQGNLFDYIYKNELKTVSLRANIKKQC